MNLYFCLNCFSRLDRERERCPHCGKATRVHNKQNQLEAGSVLQGRYLTGGALGEGGFGITYRGYDLKTNRMVAIKEFYPVGKATRSGKTAILPSQQYEDYFRQEREKFINEARVLARFRDEAHIVRVWDFFRENNTAYTVMEYLEGADLSAWLRENGPQPFEVVFRMLEPVMQALATVHSQGLIHRDISPSNLMLLEDGSVKLLDFGTTRVQSVGGERSLSVLLKPGFAPEEQYRRRGKQGPWTDVYALCATIYSLITGFSPEPSADRMMQDQLLLPSARGAKIKPEQESVLMKGLAVQSEDRWQSMEELRAAFAANIVVKPRKKKKPMLLASAVAAVLALAIVGGALLFAGRSDTASPGEPAGSADPSGDVSAEKPQTEKVEYITVEKYLVVQENWYSEDGTLSHQVFHDYNKYGNETLRHYVGEYNEYRQVTEFSEDGIPLSTVYDSKDLYERTVYEENGSRSYDREGNLTQYTERKLENKATIEYTYYPNGALKEYQRRERKENGDFSCQIYDAEGVLMESYKNIVTETENGRIETYYMSDEDVITSTYDKNGVLRREERVGPYVEELLEYGEDGRMSSAVSRNKGILGGETTGQFEYELREILVPKGSI